jgi:hypothetical protein
MLMQKWSFVMYIVSSVALGYVILIHSPLRFTQKAFANTDTPLAFFGMAIVLIIHIVVSGKSHSQEQYKNVIRNSIGILVLAGILMIPDLDQIPGLIISYFPTKS